MWNYNFIGIKNIEEMNYAFVLNNPREFYHEMHRQTHYLCFNKSKEEF